MAEGARYAVYFVPREGSRLAAFGERWLGAGDGFGILERVGLTEAPRRYGFHATLKAPFYLAGGASEADLVALAQELAGRWSAFDIGRLRVERLDDFIALMATGSPIELNELAAGCVRAFELLRASLSQVDRVRRLAAGLDAREIAYLDAWGYPYVFDGFQFHMSLTGAVEPGRVDGVKRQLAQAYAAYDEPVVVDAITICRQPTRDAPFAVWQRLAFGG